MEQISRLPTAFHEKFPLKRVAVAQVINVLPKVDDLKTRKSRLKQREVLRENTALGNNYIKAMPQYARGAGLLSDEFSLTTFGALALQYDPMLERTDTQWLIHYHLSAQQGPGPEFWHNFVLSRFRTGNQFTRKELQSELDGYFIKLKGKSASNSTLQGAVNAFVNTYIDMDCLGKLGVLIDTAGTSYSVGNPGGLAPWVFAYALIDYWDFTYKNRISVNVDDLTSEQGLASLFLMDQGAVNQVLTELQQAGIVEVYRAAQPYQLLLLSHDKSLALRNLYGDI